MVGFTKTDAVRWLIREIDERETGWSAGTFHIGPSFPFKNNYENLSQSAARKDFICSWCTISPLIIGYISIPMFGWVQYVHHSPPSVAGLMHQAVGHRGARRDFFQFLVKSDHQITKVGETCGVMQVTSVAWRLAGTLGWGFSCDRLLAEKHQIEWDSSGETIHIIWIIWAQIHSCKRLNLLCSESWIASSVLNMSLGHRALCLLKCVLTSDIFWCFRYVKISCFRHFAFPFGARILWLWCESNAPGTS